MVFASVFHCPTTQLRGGRRRRLGTCKLRLEQLEDRSLPSSASALATAYGQLPLAFEANQGQAAPQVDFMAYGKSYTLSLMPNSAELALQQGSTKDRLYVQLVGGNAAAPGVGRDELITKSNYFSGSDPGRWHTNIANYAKVEYQNVYPGVNLVYYGNQGQLEYDFVVAPGANPGLIQLSIEGARSITLDAQGNLVLHTSGSDIVEQAPVVYQTIGGSRRPVSGQFVLAGDNQVGFQIGAYDHSQPLVIDPVLRYSSYIGVNFSAAFAIAVDSAGAAYVTGTGNAGAEAYVAKLNAAGTALVYQTNFAADFLPQGYGIAVDSAGNAYVTGWGGNNNFPTTPNAFAPTGPGGFFTCSIPPVRD